MRILFVGRNVNIGGGTTFRLNIGRSLIERGHQVSVSALGGPMANAYRKAGIRYHWGPSWAWCAGILVRHLRRDDVEIVHASNTTAGDAALVAARRTGLPLVLSLHNTISTREAQHECLKGARKIIVFDAGAAQSASNFQHEFDPSKIVRLPRPVEHRPLDPAALSPYRVAYVGRLSKRKGKVALELIRAFGEYARGVQDAQLRILGAGNLQREVAAQAEQTSRETGCDIRFLGQVLDPHPILAQTGIVVGAGYAALEALMCGRAVIGAGFLGFGPIDASNLAEADAGNFGDTVHRWDMTADNFLAALRSMRDRWEDPSRRLEAWGLDRILAPIHAPACVAERLETLYLEVLRQA
jgi:glycosyltransferase involved in cell wall biosynthesis